MVGNYRDHSMYGRYYRNIWSTGKNEKISRAGATSMVVATGIVTFIAVLAVISGGTLAILAAGLTGILGMIALGDVETNSCG